MARLADLRDTSAVEAAIVEFNQLGRAAFLGKYGFPPGRDYFVQVADGLIDSKPLVAAIWAHQYPERDRLGPSDFSGGPGGAVRALTRLGLNVVTRIQLSPARLGDTYLDRTALYEEYGGDKVAGIIRFPGDAFVNVFADARGPYADDLPRLGQPFGYRGEGLNGPHRVDGGGNALLEEARLNRAPVRFWYRPEGEPFRFLTWVLVLGRTWLPGQGADKVSRPELDWQLEAVPGPDVVQWPQELQDAAMDASHTVDADPNVPEASPTASYSDLVERVESRGQRKNETGSVRTDFARSAAARRAVLLRSGGGCESPRCTGMPGELNRRGEPILDVDHIQDLALGGEDHPRNMAALCPNCHACKTRGRNTASWRRELGRAAQHADARARELDA